MNSCKTLALLILLYYIFHLPKTFSAAEEPINTKPELLQQTTSPSPSPVPGNGDLAPGNNKVDVKSKSGQETCELVSNKCHDDTANVTACLLPYAGDDSMGLIVLNEGDNALKFNVTFLPSVPTFDNIEILAHEVKKINVSASASSTSSVVLKSINWACKIQLGVPVPPGIHVPLGIPSYAEYVTPINGAYVLLGTAVLIGIMWACCKLGKHRRHSDGIPYQELEMGQSHSSLKVETATGWDQDWDDDWDEERAVRSPGGNRIGNRRANGGSSRLEESNGWDDDWKD